MSQQSRLIRLVAAALAVGFGVVVLWQAGVLFRSSDRVVTAIGESGRPISLRPAGAALETANPAGLTIGLREGDLAPDFEFSAFNGDRIKLSDFRGRPVFLNFWATWCGPCRVEMPDIEATLQRHQDVGLVAIGVNNGEAYEPAARFLRQLGVQLTAFAYDPGQDIVRRYAVHGMPTSYFIDAQGLVTRVSSGQLNSRVMESAVQEAIAGFASRSR